MESVWQPWHLLELTLSGMIQSEQETAIAYLRVENQVLREKLGKGLILLNDDQRRPIAVKGKYLGRDALLEVATFVTPDTILRWHRQLIAMKWDYSDRRKTRVGRPRIREVIVELILRIATKNEGWGYDRFQGALKNVGYSISNQTVGNVQKEHGIEPSPERNNRTTWRKFLEAHWEVMGAVDFTTVEVWTRSGLTTFYILVAIKLSTHRVEIAGVTPNPDAAWVQQIGRNLTDCYDGFLLDTKYLLVDRDTKFCPLRGVLEGTDTTDVLLPARRPNLNAYIERFMRSLKDEYLNKMILFGEKSLRRALSQYKERYHTERSHHGIGNNIIDFNEEVGLSTGSVQCRERLGGMLSYYYRDAA